MDQGVETKCSLWAVWKSERMCKETRNAKIWWGEDGVNYRWCITFGGLGGWCAKWSSFFFALLQSPIFRQSCKLSFHSVKLHSFMLGIGFSSLTSLLWSAGFYLSLHVAEIGKARQDPIYKNTNTTLDTNT